MFVKSSFRSKSHYLKEEVKTTTGILHKGDYTNYVVLGISFILVPVIVLSDTRSVITYSRLDINSVNYSCVG